MAAHYIYSEKQKKIESHLVYRSDPTNNPYEDKTPSGNANILSIQYNLTPTIEVNYPSSYYTSIPFSHENNCQILAPKQNINNTISTAIQNPKLIINQKLNKSSSAEFSNHPKMVNINQSYDKYKSSPIQNINLLNVIYNPIQTETNNNMINRDCTHFSYINQASNINNQNTIENQININKNEINTKSEEYNEKSLTQTKRRDEKLIEHKYITINELDITKQSICKIIIFNEQIIYGTGFFMKYSDSLKLLITNNHVIFREYKDDKIKIVLQIWNQKTMKLSLNGRYIKYLEKSIDITAIEIKESDKIYKEILFLDYNKNYEKFGYKLYNKEEIFSIQHPNGGDASIARGNILGIVGLEFIHNIPTDSGSSGCPIILLNNNINLIQVIGIHKNSDTENRKGGTFIGVLINEINKDPFINNKLENINSNNNNNNNNYIIAEININKDDVNKDIKIINSYEEYMKLHYNYNLEENLKNEEQIKECKIAINNEPISFNYSFIFNEVGNYKIKYEFKHYLTNTNYMFSECNLVTSLNLSNFKTQDVSNMSYMFNLCDSLTSLDLSNINTINVTDMSYMFCGCISLNNLNILNFNTQKVTNMSHMFCGCKSLINLDLSKFNTENITDMGHMFSKCESLINLNISQFNTKNVINMAGMFLGCSTLTNLDLYNFTEIKVNNISFMFFGCKSLIKLIIPNFKIKNVSKKENIFYGCNSLMNVEL